jgi:asparagine synthase (glutamine-hydrolysing)
MCGIAGAVSLSQSPVTRLERTLAAMNTLTAHRGPDGEGVWRAPDDRCGLAHRRLAIIDLGASGRQPMRGRGREVIVYNGEIYNYVELRRELEGFWSFRSQSDTETILAAYARWGADCVAQLRGMFAFAIFDGDRLFAARDRFGIKPLYYAEVSGVLYFASEMKALLPFLPEIATDDDALAEYLTFQFMLGDATLFKHIRAVPPGATLTVERGCVTIRKYWDLQFEPDDQRSAAEFELELRAKMEDSVRVHLRSDVPVGAYVSGGVDSSLIAILAAREPASARIGFHGKFSEHPAYDESRYARTAAAAGSILLHEINIRAEDFSRHIEDVVFHLDAPTAGPGSFPQFMVSGLAARHVKVVLGGQGGDEIFGGYARYLVAYLAEAAAAAIDPDGRETPPIPLSVLAARLGPLKEYFPLLRKALAELGAPLADVYFQAIDRSADLTEEIDWRGLDRNGVVTRYRDIFLSPANVPRRGPFDLMTHFDFKTLLPALLQVEDRMAMAHGLESRVPMLDHSIVELAARMPTQVKFGDGELKRVMRATFSRDLPTDLVLRRDKMGFPVPLNEWLRGPLREFAGDILMSARARQRPHVNAQAIQRNFDSAEQFSRKAWGLLCLELWQRRFHDRAGEFHKLAQG